MPKFKLNSRSLTIGWIIGVMVSTLNGLPALAATVTLTETVAAGTLSITSQTSIALAGATVSTSNQNITALSGTVTYTDTRGTGKGWAATIASTNLGIDFDSMSSATLNALKRVTVGSSGGISSVSGSWNGQHCQTAYSGTGAVPCGEISILVTAVTSGNPTAVTVTAADATTSTPTVTASAFATQGVTITMVSTGVAVNDVFKLRTDSFLYTEFSYLSNSLISLNNASLTGVDLGPSGNLTGSGVTSDAFSTLTAAVNSGMGAYTTNDNLTWNLHSNPIASPYKATLTYTIA